MNLISLPREILADIFSLLYLSKQDLKSLRLTCHEFARVTTPTLFYRIRISPLLQDFESFFGISKSPHLAAQVRVLVWEELGGFFHIDESYWPERVAGPECQLFKDVTENASNLFLLDIENVSGDFTMDVISDESSIPRSNLPDEFLSAIRDTMPNLHTLASKPMDSRRCLEIPSMDYAISVEALKRILQYDESACLFNLGFTAFLLPAMESLAIQSKDNNSTNKITQLFYADEGASVNTSIIRIDSYDKAFEHLRHLDLCLAMQKRSTKALAGFWLCLANAKSLTSLKLCSEGGPVPYLPKNIPTLPQLAKMEFVETNILSNPMCSATVDFIKRHAGTLKRLYFTSSLVKKKLLKDLAKMNSLQLERFVITSGHDADDGDDDDEDYDDEDSSGSDDGYRNECVNELAVLNYINLMNSPGKEKTPPPFQLQDEEKQIYTHPLIFDPLTSELAAFHDTRDNRWEKRGYEPVDIAILDSTALERRNEYGIAYDIGPRRIYHSITDLWVDSDGVFYCPVTDEEIPDPVEKRDKPEDDSWNFQGQRTWDPEMGLWRD
ncbi:hypothetical protein IL306_000808 [Fusarium sp. DS 682]|nr:hypothetical protein IL306_000808 [Fusarium sp. DS 682]